MTQAVGFDLDNTLYDQAQHLFPFFGAAAAHLSEQTGIRAGILEITFRTVWNAVGSSYPKLFDIVLERHGIYDPQTVRVLVRMYHECVGRLKPYDGVRPLLDRLYGRLPLFLVTDGDPAMQRRKIQRLGIGHLFRTVVFSAEEGLGRPKPHPAPFLRALESLQCAPGKCLFVGDHPRCDITGAALVGMKTARVLTGAFRSLPSAGIEPDFTIGSAAEIEKMLR